MLSILKTWLQSKIRLIEWGVLAVALVGMYYAGYHTRVVLDEAAKSRAETRVINSIPQIITKTQTLTKVIHDAHDSCTGAHIPDSIAKQLH